MSKKEAAARIKINDLLKEAGWRFEDNTQEKANIQLEQNVKIGELGDNFEKTKNGFIDYLLLDESGFPICVLEAKKESISPLEAKEQARNYAHGKNCRFVILSNGISHYLWDLEQGNPEPISRFPSQKSLEQRKEYQKNVIDLGDAKIEDDYLSQSKKLRYYQLESIRALQESAKNGNERFLFEMATGTGKTFVAAAVCKLFLTTGNAKRILFLVDRIELEDQAVKSFSEIFKDVYFVGKVKGGNWQHCQIVVSTIQTLLKNNRYRKLFSTIDFELVISDEAHRSISGDFRAVFEYFIGFKLGLTATPNDYLKGVDEKDLAQKNIKALEYRKLRDTYKTFGCGEDKKPTYRYDLKKGIQDDFLISPYVIDARTEITTDLLSKEGYEVSYNDEEEIENEAVFTKKDFEKIFFNDQTNQVFCKSILENGLKDPISGEFGKTLVFCVSQNHANKITQILNQLADKKYPNKYNSNFAVQITSNINDSSQFTKDFSANKLLGKSDFAQQSCPDYGTSKARVCVTVGMMTTGYDCPDLLNVVLMRAIFSPTDFIQMKGRGTRKHTFNYLETGEKREKKEFLLLDFFANCEYFENEFDYDKKTPLNIVNGNSENDDSDPIIRDTPSIDTVDLDTADNIKTETVIYVGKEGMKIDRELYQETYEQFEYVLNNNPTIQTIKNQEGEEAVEEFIKKEVFNKPTEYWTAEKIRQSYEEKHKTKRKISLTEMILKALGLLNKFKSRQERLDEEYQKLIDIEKPKFDPTIDQQDKILKTFFENYLSDKYFRQIIDSEKYAELSTYTSFGMKELKKINNIFPTATIYAQEYLTKEMAEFGWQKQ